MPALPPRRPSLVEVSGPDKRIEAESREEYLERMLREARANELAAKRTNSKLLERLGVHVQEKQSVRPLAPIVAPPIPQAPKQAPHWVGIVTAVLVAAVGGGGAGAGITKAISGDKVEDVMPEMQKLRDRIYAGERADAKRQEYLRDRQGPEEMRWKLLLGWLCKVNAGQAFARGVNCGDGIEWTTPPIRPKYYRTEETWPRFEPAP